MIKRNRITIEVVLDLARRELELREAPYVKNSLHANCNCKSISIGSKQGWLISAKLKVPETFKPDMILIEISDPEGFINIPDVLQATLEILL